SITLTPTNTPTITSTPTSTNTPTGSQSLVISQVYGGGGNVCAPWHNDFVELFNPTNSPISFAGWSVQYASATGIFTGTNNQVTVITGTVQPHSYFLVQEAAGSGGGDPLPTPDATGNMAIASVAGKVALVNNATPLGCGSATNRCMPPNPNYPSIVDLVGYGSNASSGSSPPTDWEGADAARAASNTSSVVRQDS